MPDNALDIKPNDKVVWADMHKLAKQIDELATLLAIPSYPKLLEDEDYPFQLEGVYEQLPSDLRIHFNVNSVVGADMSGSAIVTSHYLSAGQENAWKFPEPVLKNLADDDELHLVTEEDKCWCNAVHKVTAAGDIARLVTAEVAETERCCWSVKIPDIGQDLFTTDSAVISVPAVKYFTNGLTLRNDRTVYWYALPSCKDGDSTQYFKLTRTKVISPSYALYRLSACERSITPAFLTWPVLKKYWERLNKALFDDLLYKSGGAKMYRLRNPTTKPQPEHSVPPEGGAVTVCSDPPAGGELDPPNVPYNEAWQDNPDDIPAWATGVARYWTYPGCTPNVARLKHMLWCELEQHKSEKPGAVVNMEKWPWEGLFYGAKDCSGTGKPMLYAETMNQYSKMVDMLSATEPKEVKVWDRRNNIPATPMCCFEGVGAGSSATMLFNGPTLVRIPACEPAVELEDFLEGGDFSNGNTPGALWTQCPERDLPPEQCNKLFRVAGMPEGGEKLVAVLFVAVQRAPLLVGCAALTEPDPFNEGSNCTHDCGGQALAVTVNCTWGSQSFDLSFTGAVVPPVADSCTYIVEDPETGSSSCDPLLTDERSAQWAAFEATKGPDIKYRAVILDTGDPGADLFITFSLQQPDIYPGSICSAITTESDYTGGGSLHITASVTVMTKSLAEDRAERFNARNDPPPP